MRVETDADGAYEAHVRKSDGTEVEVKMDKDFKVTSVEEFQGRGGRGGGHRGGPGPGETPLTGDDATKATAAAQKAVEGGTVIRVETDADGVYEAHVRKSDGTEVEVKMDKDFTVTSVEEFQGRGGHRPDGTDDDSTDVGRLPLPDIGQTEPMNAAVLVADDDRAIRESLATALELAGYEVTTCADGVQALAALHARPFDVVILDVMMPGVDGLGVCSVLRAEGNRVPILMVTARTETRRSGGRPGRRGRRLRRQAL